MDNALISPLLFRGGATRLGRVSGLVAVGWGFARNAAPTPTPHLKGSGL